MAKHSAAPHHEILAAALQGLEAQKQKLDEQIAQVRSMLGGRVSKPVSGGTAKKRILSPEARQRIAAAQKKRWAEHRKTVAQATKQPAKTGGS